MKKIEEFDLNKLNPGIKNAVSFFRHRGYETTDSGDGTNFNNGMEGSLPYDHVAITVQNSILIEAATHIQDLLLRNQCNNVLVEATYFPKEKISVILISDPDQTFELRKLK